MAKGDTEKMDKHIFRVKNSVKGLTEILEDILSLSKLEEGKTEVDWKQIDLKHWIEEWMDELTPILKPGQRFQLNYNTKVEVVSDHKVLKNIILNILSNAVKFSPENSIIKIEVGVKNNQLQIQIEDNGMGIPAGELAHLFQRFHRASNATNVQGTGLGLSIVKKCLELLGVIS